MAGLTEVVAELEACCYLMETLADALNTPDEAYMIDNIARDIVLHQNELSAVVSSLEGAISVRGLLGADSGAVLDGAIEAAGRLRGSLDAIAAAMESGDGIDPVEAMRTFPGDFRLVARSRHILIEALRA